MRCRCVGVVVAMAIAVVAADAVSGQETNKPTVAGQTAAVPRTPDGHPDLGAIWGQLMAPPEKVDPNVSRDRRGGAAITDLARAYNEVWSERGVPGGRATRIVDPPDGKTPELTREAVQRQTDWVKRTGKVGALATGKRLVYGSTTEDGTTDGFEGGADGRGVRADGPEDRLFQERCITGGEPGFGGFRRIVQGPESLAIYRELVGGISIRVIPITSRPHLPKGVLQWLGDSRARWEGDTLVVDTTNFSDNYETTPRGSGSHLHLIERYTRIDANTLKYEVTYDDLTTWVKPWTQVGYMTKQSDEENRIFEYACHEGNYGMTNLLAGTRTEERAKAAKVAAKKK